MGALFATPFVLTWSRKTWSAVESVMEVVTRSYQTLWKLKIEITRLAQTDECLCDPATSSSFDFSFART